jgi:coproporphyrinogen III oxidase-like Fe-S oxidoreductase
MTLGVQTINKDLITSMKRFQDEEKITYLFNLMKKYNFSINLDLIYCLP